MAHKKERNTGFPGEQKPEAAKRTVNPTGGAAKTPLPGRPADQQHDVKARQGSFGGKGEHPRTGNPGHQ